MICETNNQYLIKIRQKQLEKTLSIGDSTLNKTDPVQKNHFFENLICTQDINCELIKDLKRAFECTFIPDTVFKFVSNKYFIGLKCMVIKNRDSDFEYAHPEYHLEWDNLYSEAKGDFNVVYFLYNPVPVYGKIIIKNGYNDEFKEIISGIVFDKSNRTHINQCFHIFRQMYLTKFQNM